MQNAMEGTVLHVPCIPSKRWRGFWRSSVRGLGPPPTSRSSANGERMPLSGERPSNGSFGRAHALLEPVPRRVARPSARTRSSSCVAVRSAGARREASPQADIAADEPEQPIMNALRLQSLLPRETGGMGRFNDVSGRFETSQTSLVQKFARPSTNLSTMFYWGRWVSRLTASQFQMRLRSVDAARLLSQRSPWSWSPQLVSCTYGRATRSGPGHPSRQLRRPAPTR